MNKKQWWEHPLRVYQANNFEVDPREIPGDRIAQQCEDLNCNTIIVDAGGGISTFYHSDVEYLTPNPYLRPDQDYFKEMMDGCRKRGIRVFARNDYGNLSLETFKQHPDWAMRHRDGTVPQVYDVVYTCPSSPMFLEIPIKAFQEQIKRYDIDGIYINSMGGRCYCARCQSMFHKETGKTVPPTDDWNDPDFRAWIEWGYDLVDRIAQAQYKGVTDAKADCCYFIDAAGMQEHSWIRVKGEDLIRHAKYESMASTEAFNDLVKGYPAMLAPIMSRYIRNCGDHLGKPGAIFISSFPGHSWPRMAQPVEEYRSYLASAFFNGCWAITPWYGHCEREDRRITPVATEVFGFMKKHEAIFNGAVPEAPVAIVYSRRTADHYGHEEWKKLVMDPLFAACHALINEGIPFKIISDEQLECSGDSAPLTGVKTFVLPNIACLSDTAAAFLDRFVENGGALVADFDTGLFDETGAARSDFAVKCFGVSMKERIPDIDEEWTTSRLHAYLEITDPAHALFNGFSNTGILPQKGPWVEVEPAAGSTRVVCRHIRKSSAQPPEKGWRGEKGSTPMVTVNGKAVYFAIPIFNLLARYRLPDHRRLFANAVRMVTALPITLDAPGPVELSILRLADGRRAIGLINHTAAVLREPAPVATGPVRIKFDGNVPAAARALNGTPLTMEKSSVVLETINTFDLILLD
jgi:hypothetical protein